MKTSTLGWVLLIIIFLIIAHPAAWILATLVVILFRVPRFAWNWWYVNVLHEEEIKE